MIGLIGHVRRQAYHRLVTIASYLHPSFRRPVGIALLKQAMSQRISFQSVWLVVYEQGVPNELLFPFSEREESLNGLEGERGEVWRNDRRLWGISCSPHVLRKGRAAVGRWKTTVSNFSWRVLSIRWICRDGDSIHANGCKSRIPVTFMLENR